MTTTDPKLIERASLIAEQAYSAGNLVTCDGYYEFDLDAAAAVIAAAINEAAQKEREGIVEASEAVEATSIADDAAILLARIERQMASAWGLDATEFALLQMLRRVLPSPSAIEAHKESQHGDA